MPSASTKSSLQAAAVATSDLMQEPLKSAISVLDKKQRNLEKRKLKLLETKKKAEEGCEINQEQKEALERLALVDESVGTVRELHKIITSLDQEYTKLVKKEQKRVKQEKKDVSGDHSTDNFFKVVEIQGILAVLSEDVRPDFLNGTNGACQLTENDLQNLDTFYDLVNLGYSDGGERKLSQRTKNVAVHLDNLVQGNEKAVFDDVTYQSLLNLLNRISDSGYFDKNNVSAPAEEAVTQLDEPTQDEAPQSPIAHLTLEPIPQKFEQTIPSGHQSVNGVDLPPDVQQTHQNEQFDFMGESEIQLEVCPESSPPPLNPVSPEFIPRNLQQSSDDTSGWGEPGQNNQSGWTDSANTNESVGSWQSVESHHGNQQSGFRGRGGRGRGFGGRGRGRGAGGNGFRGRDGGNSRGGSRGQRGGPRGGPRGGQRGNNRGGFGNPQQQQQQQQ